MDEHKQYEIIDSDGTARGFFLDNRLYEYLTSTCIGYLNEQGEVVDGETRLGKLNENTYIQEDGKTYRLQLKQSPVSTEDRP